MLYLSLESLVTMYTCDYWLPCCFCTGCHAIWFLVAMVHSNPVFYEIDLWHKKQLSLYFSDKNLKEKVSTH